MPLAGYGQRILAYLVDGVLMAVPQLLLSIPFLIPMVRALVDEIEKLEQAETLGQPVDPFWVYSMPEFWLGVLGSSVIGLAVSAAYTIIFLATRGATPGKSLVGIRVRSWATEQRPTWGQATRRWASGALPATLISFYVYLDLLWPLWDQRRQALHDKWPGTVVVQRNRSRR